MRSFWSLIGIAIIATVILWILEDQPSPTPGPGPSAISPLRSQSTAATASQESPDTVVAPAEQDEPQPPDSAPASSVATDGPSTPATPLEQELLASAEQREDLPAVRPLESEPSDSEASDTKASSLEPGLDLGLDRTIPYATIVPGRIVRSSPTELEADGEFTLIGAGTREDPYQPSWEYLYSAGTVYKPRLGEDALPQRIALLDGTWVTIAGHTAFPLVTGESDEMLVMLNQWDGCCIGVPPTPFDAIEVRLQEAVKTGPKHSFSYGTVTGRLKVDPYLIENWLVGLYILEESDLQNDL